MSSTETPKERPTTLETLALVVVAAVGYAWFKGDVGGSSKAPASTLEELFPSRDSHSFERTPQRVIWTIRTGQLLTDRSLLAYPAVDIERGLQWASGAIGSRLAADRLQVNVKVHVTDQFNRQSESVAITMEVSSDDIAKVERWNSFSTGDVLGLFDVRMVAPFARDGVRAYCSDGLAKRFCDKANRAAR